MVSAMRGHGKDTAPDSASLTALMWSGTRTAGQAASGARTFDRHARLLYSLSWASCFFD